MRRFPTIHFVAASLLAGLPTFPTAAEPEERITPLAIFDAALTQFENNRVALRKWQYYQTLTTHQLDGAGKVVGKGTWRTIVRPGDPRPLEYTATSMEGKLSFFKAGTEEPAPAKTSGTPAPRTKVEPEKNQSESAVDAVRKKLAFVMRNKFLAANINASGIAVDQEAVIAAIARRDIAGAAALVPDEAVEAFGIAGTPRHCTKRLHDFIEAGINEPVLGLLGSSENCLLALDVMREFVA